jgi:hypothetical protein
MDEPPNEAFVRYRYPLSQHSFAGIIAELIHPR